MRPTSLYLLACALIAWLAAGSAAAQTQVKPYFLVVFDTSGSMADPPELSNSCGFTPTRKISAAKCVLGRILNATGDAEFGLMQFGQATARQVSKDEPKVTFADVAGSRRPASS